MAEVDEEAVWYPEQSAEGSWVRDEEREYGVREKSFRFSLSIIELYRALQDRREFVLSKQLLKSGTSIGANVEEATAAQSRRDFIAKMAIASKEARETSYWLRLLDASKLVPGIDYSRHLEAAHELIRLLTAIVKTTAQNPHPKTGRAGARTPHRQPTRK